jgi:hypothetical protein
MKQEAVKKIKMMLTPEVQIISCYDHEGEIKGEVEHRYGYPCRKGEPPIPWARRFSFTADINGNVTSTEGLF